MWLKTISHGYTAETTRIYEILCQLWKALFQGALVHRGAIIAQDTLTFQELDAKITTIFLLKSETSAFIMDNTSYRTDDSHASTPMMVTIL